MFAYNLEPSGGHPEIRAHCTLADPSTRKGANCALQGLVDGSVVVTKAIRQRFSCAAREPLIP